MRLISVIVKEREYILNKCNVLRADMLKSRRRERNGCYKFKKEKRAEYALSM